jgi:DNA-binding SARP family transcriptional activator
MSLLGVPKIDIDGQPLVGLMHSPMLVSLLAFLAVNQERVHARSVLASMFWPDQPERRARRNLNSHLWRLRVALDQQTLVQKPPGERDDRFQSDGYIGSDSQSVFFVSHSKHWLDVKAFEVITASIPHFCDVRADEVTKRLELPSTELEAAVTLYRGEFLEGIYDDWCIPLREHLRERYLLALQALAQAYEDAGCFHQAIDVAQRLVHADAFREDGHARLIRLYARLGRQADARAQFCSYEHIWIDELIGAPSPTMMALAHGLKLLPEDVSEPGSLTSQN